MFIQTNNLESTFRALRNRNPQNLEKQVVPLHRDYKGIPKQNYSPTTTTNAFGSDQMYRFASASTGGGGVVYGQPQFFSPVHTPINWQIPSKRLEQYQWARFFYENEPKIAASIDFYSYFPMNDYEHECKNRDVRVYFDKFKKRIDLAKWTRLISHEVHLLGDCFPFIEIGCPHCGGSGRIGDEICEHYGGTVKRMVILNPDYVDVFSTPMSPDPVIALKPDQELIAMVQGKMPGHERLTPEVRNLVLSGQPIRLDNRSVTHMKYGEGGYTKYGTGMVRRLFPILSYKTKLMVAQWIVAERLIVPIKIVKVGSDERPAGPADIAAVQEQLAQTANDPNLTIVTHHAFELDWQGASGKVLTLTNEFEFINEEILDGMMINNALLNGEGPTYNNASIGIESMIERLETFRREIAQWIEQHIYLPEAMRQGFIEHDPETGEDEFIYPKIKWNSMHLRDQQQYRQSVLQLYEKGLLSAQTVLEVFDFDPDTEIERKRYDAVQMMALGQGAGGGMGGGFGGDMGMGGGDMGLGGDLGGGDMGGDLGGGDLGGGDMGGDLGGGDLGGGDLGAGATSNKRMVITSQKKKEIALLESRLQNAREQLRQAMAKELTNGPISIDDMVNLEISNMSNENRQRMIELWEEALVLEPKHPERYIESIRYDSNLKLNTLASTEKVDEFIKLSQNESVNIGDYGGKVLKQKTREKIDSQKRKTTKNDESHSGSSDFGSRDEKGRIIFTRPERQLMDGIVNYKKNGLIQYAVVPQLAINYGGREYPVDFAIPALKIALEADGEMFHSSEKQVKSDNERDAKLAQLGWTVLRFKDTEIEKSIERVMQTVVKTIMQKEMALNKIKGNVKKT